MVPLVGGDPVLALIFDFDDTLVPDSTTLFLESKGVDAHDLWTREVPGLVADGYDPTLAWLRLFLDRVGPGEPLGTVSNEELKAFGRSLDERYYEGLPEFFDEVTASATEILPNARVEFYVVSSGLRSIIEGSAIVQRYFRGVYACDLDEAGSGMVRHIKRAVTFTEKTRYLFEINKGIAPEESRGNPQLVNEAIDNADRRVPFENMVYVGDGLSDIPCFSLVDYQGGQAYGIMHPEEEAKGRRAFLQLLEPRRVQSLHRPRYSAGEDLGIILRYAVTSRCSEIKFGPLQARSRKR